MENEKEIVLRPSKSKHLTMLAISAAFTAVGIWMGLEGKWIGYLCAAFFGLACLVFVVQLFPGASFLKIRVEGFEYSSLFRRHFVRWKDVKEFGILTQSHARAPTNKMVSWNYVDDYDKSNIGRSISKGISGFEAGLPDTYGLKAEELLNLMMKCRAMYKKAERQHAAPADIRNKPQDLSEEIQ